MNAGKIVIVSVILAASPVLAGAEETLQYIGSPFTSLTITGNIANALAMDTPPENTGEIVLAAPLGDNLDDAPVTPLSWSFDDGTSLGGFYLMSELSSNTLTFTASTNAQGNLTAWSINAGGNDFGSTNTPSFATMTIANGGDSFAVGESGFECSPPPGGLTPCYNVSESNSSPGIWKAEVSSVPEIDMASAYAALTVLLGGLAILRGARRRRSTLSGYCGTAINKH